MNKKNAALLAALILISVAACTGTGEKGQASPETTPPTSQSQGKLPKRPAELKVDNVDPCKLLTAQQMDEVRIAKSSPEQSKVIDGAPLPSCYYQNSTKYAYIVVPATNKGVEYWGAGGNVTADPTEVAGYGAIEVKFIGVDAFDCAVSIDVAEGQQLFVSYHPDRDDKETQEQMCDKAKKVAGLALATLKTLK